MNLITVAKGTREHQVAMHTLTYVGSNENDDSIFSDLGCPGYIDLYRKRLQMCWSETLQRYVTIPTD